MVEEIYNWIVIFEINPLYLLGYCRQIFTRKDFIFSQNKILIPKISSPTSTSHEPGVKGVKKAIIPMIMQKIPTVRRKFLCLYQ